MFFCYFYKDDQIESNIGLRCRPRNPNPRVKWLMPEKRFIKFPALSVDPRVGTSRSASDTDGSTL